MRFDLITFGGLRLITAQAAATSTRTGQVQQLAAATAVDGRTHSRTTHSNTGARRVSATAAVIGRPENTPPRDLRGLAVPWAPAAAERRPPATATGHTVWAIHHRPCGLYQRTCQHLSRALLFSLIVLGCYILYFFRVFACVYMYIHIFRLLSAPPAENTHARARTRTRIVRPARSHKRKSAHTHARQ